MRRAVGPTLAMASDNGVPFTTGGGQVLAALGGSPVVSLSTAGDGEVLVIADLGVLGDGTYSAANLRFWNNLASYARPR